MANTIADDIAAIATADAALAAAQTGVTAAQATLAAAQTADTAADALVAADLAASGPVFILSSDGSTAAIYTASPTAPGFTVSTAKVASSIPSTTPPPAPATS
jgi:hypothetical protein